MRRKASPLVFGSKDDPHVNAVVAKCSRRSVVIDVDQITQSTYSVSSSAIALMMPSGELRIGSSESCRRGWIRRLMPMDWEHNLKIGSLKSARKVSWLSLSAHIARSPDVEWLTNLDTIHIGESKMRQYSVASEPVGGLCSTIPLQ